ncbi:MAG: hypothetical protein Kow00108_07680 [Calditrichia bacterium]
MKLFGLILPFTFIVYTVVVAFLTLDIQYKSDMIDLDHVLLNQLNNSIIIQLGGSLNQKFQQRGVKVRHETSLEFLLDGDSLEKIKQYNEIYIYDEDSLRARFLAYFFYLKYGISAKILSHVRNR